MSEIPRGTGGDFSKSRSPRGFIFIVLAFYNRFEIGEVDLTPPAGRIWVKSYEGVFFEVSRIDQD